MRSTLFYSIFFFQILILTCCKNKGEENDNSNSFVVEEKKPIKPIYAKGFVIDTIQGGFQKLSIIDVGSQNNIATYILVPKGGSYQPLENEICITVPIDNLGVFTTSSIGFLEVLGALDHVVTVENKNYIYNPILHIEINKGKITEIGFSGQMNLEKLLLSPTEIIITSAFASGVGKDFQKAKEAGIATIFLSEWQEQHPLARAEWIKCFGALLGKEDLADSIFNDVQKKYKEVKQLCQSSEKLPSVLFSTPYQGIWYLPGGQSYVSQLLRDAKGVYPWSENKNTGSINLTFENVANQYPNPDVWINPEAGSLSEIKSMDSRFSYFLDKPNISVFQNNLRTTPQGGNDYWELGVVRPDLLLMDYGKMLHPNLFENTNFTFFQKLD